MRKAAAWNVRGIDAETLGIAEEAARRAGMSLSEWLDEVVAEQAAEQGVTNADLDDADRPDAIGDRFARISRRDERTSATRRRQAEDRREGEKPHRIVATDADQLASQRIEAAIDKFEARASQTDAKTAKALQSVAAWIERSEADRAAEQSAMQTVAQKLTAMERLAAKDANRSPETAVDVDARLNELTRRVAAAERPRTESSRLDLRDSVARIARRQSALDAREGATGMSSPQRESLRRVDSEKETSLAPANAAAPQDAQALRAEIAALGRRLDRMRAEQAARRPEAADADGLRAGFAAMSRSVADIAPRNATVAIEGAVDDLGQRLMAARRAGASDQLLAPVEAMIGQVLDTLRAHDPNIAAKGLEREIHALASKVDSLASRAIEPATLERIRVQTEEARNLLAAAARNPMPAERLERQIGDLADRVERLASNPTPHAETARVVQLLADARAQIERSTPASALATIERRLEQLAERMDDALRRPTPSFDMKPFQDLAQRVEGVRASIERQGETRPDVSSLEAAVRDLGAKLDRPMPNGFDSTALNSTLQSLTARLEEAFRAPEVDAKSWDDLSRQVEDLRGAMERRPDFAPHAAKLEATLDEIRIRLDRPAPPAAGSNELNATLQSLTARLEQAFKRAEPAATLDARPIEDLARRIDDVRASVERQSDFRSEAAKLEAALGEISAKLDRHAPPSEDAGVLLDTLRDLALRIDKRREPVVDTSHIENLLQNLGQRPVEIDTARFETLLHDLGEKFALAAAPSAVDTAPIEDLLHKVDAKLDQVVRQPIDARPLEAAIRELHDKLDFRTEPQIDSRLIEHAAELLADRIQTRGASGIDGEGLVDQIAEIHGRLDSIQSSWKSNAALERTVVDLLEELETTRRLMEENARAPAASPLAGDLADLRADKLSSDRRMEARLADVQDILETLVERLGRIEDDMGGADAPVPEPRSEIRQPAAASPARSPSNKSATMRDIPDRAASPAATETATPRARAEANILLEPGVASPQRGWDANPIGAAATSKAEISAHIAAARRGAQAAMLDVAAKTAANAKTPASADLANKAASTVDQARAYFAARRRPILLGAALLALTTTLAVFELRGSRPHAEQKSEVTTPAPEASPLASIAKPSDAVDFSPLASISSHAPAAAAPAGLNAAPADLVAALPAELPTPLREAAAAGDAAAETEMALRCYEGRTVARDPKQAARWFELAAVQNVPFAQYRLAALYEKGVGVSRDAALARSWYLKAANAGNARAMHNLAVLYAEDGGAGKPDYVEAARWFRKAAEFGVRDSQFNLGVLYGRGLGIAQDLTQSWMWFSLASQQGDADAARKRDEVAVKLDAKAMALASKSLADFKAGKPSTAANEPPAPAQTWDAKPATPQASQPGPAPAPGAVRG